MVKIADKAQDNFFPCYLNDGDFLKIEITEGKVIKDNDNQISVYCLAETGISAELQPLRLQFHKGKYKGYDFKQKKVIDDNQAYLVEEYIFDTLTSDDFPKDGFKGIIIHAKDLDAYKKKSPVTGIEECEISQLPAIPNGSGSGYRSKANPKEYALGAIEAKTEWFTAQCNDYFASKKVEFKATSLIEIFQMAMTLQDESKDAAEEFSKYRQFLNQFMIDK